MTMSPRDEGPGVSPAVSGDEVKQLRQALASRPVIDQAKGMLMAQQGCSADEAFDMLRQASNRDNRKLREIAVAMVEARSDAGLPPDMRSNADLAARELAADDRDRVADLRQDALTEKAVGLDQREAGVEALLKSAVVRDQLAERRDRRAEQRDRDAEDRLPASLDDSAAAATEDRGQASLDRYQAGVDRDCSASDRADLGV